MFVPSIRVPLYGKPDDNMTYNDLGNEFSKMQELDRDRGLIDPTKKNPLISLTNDTDDLYVDGIPNQLQIFENNYDVNDKMIYSDAQQRLRLQAAGSINPEYTDDEKLLMEQLNFDLDPQLRQVLYRESTGSGDNIYSQQSMDFVKQIQEDVQNYFDERNLYYAGLSTDDITRAKLSGLTQEQRNLLMGEETLLDPLASAFVEASRQAGEQRKAQQKLKEDIIREQTGKRSKTTEEKVKTTKTSSPSPAPRPAPRPSPPKGKRKAKGEL
jgi:hypothetical protein